MKNIYIIYLTVHINIKMTKSFDLNRKYTLSRIFRFWTVHNRLPSLFLTHSVANSNLS